MSVLANTLPNLTPQQRALLELRLREQRGQGASVRIAPRADRSNYPMSFAQRRLWFVEQLDPSGSAYHMSAAIRIDGPLSILALEHSFTEIIKRHEVLRGGYTDVQGRPVQQVAGAAPWRVPVLDVLPQPLGERVHAARNLVESEVQRPFDLANGPLLRTVVVRLSDTEHVLVVVMHHIAADGWSMSVLVKELSALYSAFVDGQRMSLPTLPIQYADFAEWQQTHVAGERLTAGLQWWKQQLAGLPVLDLPTDRPRSMHQSTAGAREPILLPSLLVARLHEASRGRGATLFMVLLAGFQTLLMRWSGQTDIAVGCPVAGRNSQEVENLIGLFVNTVVCRTRFAGDPTAAEVLDQVRAAVTGALEHEDVPFEKLVEELNVERTLSRAPLTSVFFSFQNVPPAAVSLGRASLSEFEFDRRSSRFDLSLFAVETSDGIRCSMEYRTALFDQRTVRRMLEAYVGLLHVWAEDGQRRVKSLPLLDDAERARLTVEWNDTASEYDLQPVIPDLIAKHAAIAPDKIALAEDSGCVTYGELDRNANRMARYLAAQGVGPEAIVAIYADRGIPFVTAALAVMKAGGAYAPIDAKMPPARVGRILDKAGIARLMVTGRGLELAPEWASRVIDVTAHADEIDRQSDQPFASRAEPDQLAYVIHTSGSTGEPNGVAITHASLLNLIAWHQRTYAVDDRAVAAQVASVGFDACVWELWPYLAAGAAVHFPSDDTRDDPPALWAWISEKRVTTMFLPTPLAEAALREPLPSGLALRALLTGGDRLHSAPREPLPFALVNHYGPTESTVVATCGVVDAQLDMAPLIGRPIDNTRLYVLDAEGQPVPVGVWGELFIGGLSLARGYAGAPRLTADRFVPDPFSRDGRLYRTGDLVRYRESGALEFLGRRDHQVKLRGHRIELGEIERVLGSHQGIAVAAASIVEDPSRGPSLVAYVVDASPQPTLDDDLRAYLREQLPDYMVPSVIVRLDKLPLTRNGKIDRASLPTPILGAPAGREIVAPRNEVEEVIIAACQELLGTPASVFDNFFELGGHSLLVTQLAARLRRDLQTPVSLRMIFEAPTLAELADRLVDAMLDEPAGDAQP